MDPPPTDSAVGSGSYVARVEDGEHPLASVPLLVEGDTRQPQVTPGYSQYQEAPGAYGQPPYQHGAKHQEAYGQQQTQTSVPYGFEAVTPPPAYTPQQQPAIQYTHPPTQHPPTAYPAQQTAMPQQPYPQQGQVVVIQQPTGVVMTSGPVVVSQPPVSNPCVHLVLAIINCLCCCWVLGIIAIVYASLAMSSYSSGNHIDARAKARTALGLNIAGFVTGITLLFMLLMVYVFVG